MLLGLGAKIFVDYELSPVEPGNRTVVRVRIPAGARSSMIAQILTDKGLVRNKEAGIAAIALSGKESRLLAGSYAFNKSMSPEAMIDIIAAGKTDTVAIVVPEGFTSDQIAQRLSSKKLVDQLDFDKAATTTGQTYYFQDGFSPPRNLEGFLFPLTYEIVRGDSSTQIVRQMLDQFDKAVVQRHPEVHDWRAPVIMASLIEREAKIDSDRPLIASVYYNRLKIGMPLQCDATVQYALPQHKARLLYSDLRIDSPYNTYLHRGLPPGPICNPGKSSIDAALSPARTDYLFYVAGPGGAHIFSHTLAEQDRAIAMVRKKV